MLDEGVPIHLAELVWDHVARRFNTDPDYRQRVREVIEGSYVGRGDPPQLGRPVTRQKKAGAEAAGLRRQVGFLNVYAAAVLGDTAKISGPGPDTRPSLLAPAGSAEHVELPVRARTRAPQGQRRERPGTSTGGSSPTSEGHQPPLSPRPAATPSRPPEPSRDATAVSWAGQPGPTVRHPAVAVRDGDPPSLLTHVGTAVIPGQAARPSATEAASVSPGAAAVAASPGAAAVAASPGAAAVAASPGAAAVAASPGAAAVEVDPGDAAAVNPDQSRRREPGRDGSRRQP
jgi:hypothetical protein